MRSLWRALAVLGAGALALVQPDVARAQAPPGQPALVVYQAPTPGPGQVVTANTLTIRALVSSLPGQKLHVTVMGPANVTREVVASSTCHEVSVPVTLTHNGSYQLTVRTETPSPVAVDKCEGGTAAPRQFFAAVPPGPPSGVKAAMDQARAATVTWAKNPEPDIVAYRVQRAAGGGPFQQVGEVGAAVTSFRDGPLPPGAFRYQVLAVRRGKTPQETVVSAPSAPVSVGGTAAGGAAPGVAGGRGGSGSVSGSGESVFTGPASQAGASAGAEEGFEENLPYGERGRGEQTEELGVDETSNSSHRSLAFLAGGLLALAVFLHLRWLKRQVDQPSLV